MANVRPLEAARPSITILAGVVLLGVVVSLAKSVLIPLAMAILVTFSLTPAVAALQRRGFSRLAAVLAVVATAIVGVAAIAVAISSQLPNLASDVLDHKENFLRKVRHFQGDGPGVLDRLIHMFEEVSADMKPKTPGKGFTIPVTIENAKRSGLDSVRDAASSLMAAVGSIGLVIALTLAMLLKREDLRNRIIRLAGHGELTSTTRAIDEATRRISNYLLLQLAVNAGFGFIFGLGLALLGVHYALLWGVMAFLIRFIPYIGTWMAALLPLAFSVAVSATWFQPIGVIVLTVVLGLMVNNAIEPLLISRTTGVSPVALVVAAAFWTWMWGWIGLVLSTPMTVCLGVLGRFVAPLQFLDVLFGTDPALEPQHGYYQRLLAHDEAEAGDIIEAYVQNHTPLQLADEVLVPALVRAKEDHNEGQLNDEDLQYIVSATEELLDEHALPPMTPETNAAVPVVLGCAARDDVDELGLRMFQQLTAGEIRLEILGHKVIASDILEAVRKTSPAAVFLGAIHPGGLAKVRYLVKRLHAAFPELILAVGYWGLPLENSKLAVQLHALGVRHVATSLTESADQLTPLRRKTGVEVEMPSTPSDSPEERTLVEETKPH